MHTYIHACMHTYILEPSRASRALRFYLSRSPAYSAAQGTPPKKGSCGFRSQRFRCSRREGGVGLVRVPLGGLLEASWGLLGASWGTLGGLLEASWRPLGSRGPPGALLARLGASMGPESSRDKMPRAPGRARGSPGGARLPREIWELGPGPHQESLFLGTEDYKGPGDTPTRTSRARWRIRFD